MQKFRRVEHRLIAEALGMMDVDLLVAGRCWFGGGTAIVLTLNEYRLSLDVDFLCADGRGYRELRTAAVERGVKAFFREPVEEVRDFRVDQYGLRTMIALRGQPIKFEVVREGRISLDGAIDPELGVPVLARADLFAEKLLANADRCQDRAVAFRVALDLGMLVRAYGEIPAEAVQKAQVAYGSDIERKVAWAANALQDLDELRQAAVVLRMDEAEAVTAISTLRTEATRIWPDAGIIPDVGIAASDTRGRY